MAQEKGWVSRAERSRAFSLSQLWDTPRLNEGSGLCARRPWRAPYKGSGESGARREISVNLPPPPN